MAEVFVDQKGTSTLELRAADGRVTKVYDTVTGIHYESTNPDVGTILDEDEEPQDAEVQIHAVGSVQFRCTLDGDPSAGETPLMFETEVFDAVEPPPGAAVEGTFNVVWRPVDPAVA